MCAGYEHCLDVAVRRKWRGFSCCRCRAFQPLVLDPIDWYLDFLACTVLMGVAESEDSFKQKPRGGILDKLRRIRSKGSILGLS